ncbi:MAG: phosphotransferase family protein [Acidimicrobiales bacterium]|nr:phosphotransferase family protein [Acidimicrobiales bacterium]
MEPDEIRVALEQLLGARVDDLRRLTGGASRETWSFTADGQPRILQRERPGSPRAGTMPREAALIHAAGGAGVPVARVVASGADEAGLGTGFMVADYVEGETIARRILRDDEYATARDVLPEQCGRALAGVHRVPLDAVDGLERPDQLAQYREILDAYGDPIPAFELAFRWLEDHRPEVTGETVVHGDFRLGNLMIGPDGLRAVVDWELAHIGDPMEDLGWLCVRAWRFGGECPVAGVGSYEQLFDAYEAAAGVEVDPEIVRWWEVLGTLKWGIICIMQSRVHLDGMSRSVELAAIGRRVCENEHDLLLLLAPEALEQATARASTPSVTEAGMFGRPTAAELVEAVREYLDGDVRETASGRTAFHGRVASNALGAVQRELEQGPGMVAENVARLGGLGIGNEADMAGAIRDGRFDDRIAEVQTVVAETVVDKLRVANPGYFPSGD